MKKMLVACTLLAAAALAGCGQAPAGTLQLKPALHVNHVSGALELVAPARAEVAPAPTHLVSAGSGAIAMRFRLGAGAYGVLATAADIERIAVKLKKKSLLIDPTVATAEVPRANIASNRAIVNFTGLAAASYRIELAAYDAAGAKLGETTEEVTVSAGQTATVNAKLQLVSTPGAANIGLNVDIVNGQ